MLSEVDAEDEEEELEEEELEEVEKEDEELVENELEVEEAGFEVPLESMDPLEAELPVESEDEVVVFEEVEISLQDVKSMKNEIIRRLFLMVLFIILGPRSSPPRLRES